MEQRGQPLLALRDPSGLSEAVATLPPTAVAVIQLCDGEHTREEICREFERRYRQQLPRTALDGLLAQLDDALLLDTERFRQHAAVIFAEFARSPVRPAALAGRAYSTNPTELSALLDAYFTPPQGPGRPEPSSEARRPRALIAPHVDFHRGGPAYAWAYQPLALTADRPPELVVVLGTDHNGLDQPFTLTKKHYETPLGRIATDGELVDRLAREAASNSGDTLFRDEHHHRGEHSIEFQMVWLRHVYGERADAIRALPILCGSFGAFVSGGIEPASDPRVGGFLRALSSAVADRDVLWIAAADLAHVGPRYGDAEPLDDEDKASLERRDQTTLAHVTRGDAAGWFAEIRKERDRRRVCGLSPIYALLEAARPGSGRLAVYAQCPAEQGSIVSIASVVY